MPLVETMPETCSNILISCTITILDEILEIPLVSVVKSVCNSALIKKKKKEEEVKNVVCYDPGFSLAKIDVIVQVVLFWLWFCLCFSPRRRSFSGGGSGPVGPLVRGAVEEE